jgi:hypothetical protein
MSPATGRVTETALDGMFNEAYDPPDAAKVVLAPVTVMPALAFINELKAIDPVKVWLSSKEANVLTPPSKKTGLPFKFQTSPVDGVEGLMFETGMFNEAYATVDGANSASFPATDSPAPNVGDAVQV